VDVSSEAIFVQREIRVVYINARHLIEKLLYTGETKEEARVPPECVKYAMHM
jgi:hypothetical protein